ncbi:MAG: hypothetical protein PHY99_05695 [Bacteroidales bacterium]|nr:hypothetical protein [Bacteroidales bacterium]
MSLINRMRTGILIAGFLAFTPAIFAQQSKPQILTGKERLSQFEKYQDMKAASSLKDLKWQFLGPTNISGRCTDVAIVEPRGKSYTMYAATASGGVWKTENEGVSWTCIFDQQASTAIGDIELDPHNPQVLWVGTGEANIFRSSQAGCGIYKTTDGGKSWKHLGLENTFTISRILVSPKNSDIIYVAASGHEWTNNPDRGVYKTADGGKTWDKVLYVNEMTGAMDLVMDPSDSNTLYATTWQRIRKKWNDPRTEANYTGTGIWKTTNGGKNWSQCNEGIPAPGFRGRIGIDIARSNPKVLYAFLDNYEKIKDENETDNTDVYGRPSSGTIKGATVYRSADKGKSWTQVSGLTPEMKKYMQNHSVTYGWVFGQIRVDPKDENTIYTMGLGLNVSNDGGKTFRELEGMHCDHHGLWIDPGNTNYLVNVNDGGLVISYDQGKSWRSFTDNLPAVQFFTLNFDMGTPFKVYGSVQDHGSFSGKVDISHGRDKIWPVSFDYAPGGEGSHHAIDPRDPNIVYSAGFYGSINRENISTGENKNILPRVFDFEPPLRGQWLAPFFQSPHNPDILYHGMQYLFISKDQGNTWARISPDLTYNNPEKMGDIQYQSIFTISESPLKFGLIYAGTDDGRLHLTLDGGTTWKELTSQLAPDRWISRVVASKYKMGRVYVTQNGKRDDDFQVYIWKSEDYGATFKDISGNIPLGPVNVIREDPFDSKILYAGTDLAVYVSKNSGESWEVLGNLPTTYVHDLIVHPRDNILVIATHGRGIWAIDANLINKANERRRHYFQN